MMETGVNQIPDSQKRDAFGNIFDPNRGYAMGTVLSGPGDEVKRMLHGRSLIRERAAKYGRAGLFNLTGVTRDFPLSPDDVEGIHTQIDYYVQFDGSAEPIGITYAGGTPDRHGACLVTRVSAGMLAIMLTFAKAGDLVLSVVSKGRSHPSISNAVNAVDGQFVEVIGVDAAAEAIRELSPKIVVLTTITPQKFYFSESENRAVIDAARAAGAMVILDDAHGAVRTGFLGQRPALELGEVSLALFSMDKHLHGPRAGLVAGDRESIKQLQAKVFEYGVEAPLPSYVAARRSMEGYNPAEIQRAGVLAKEVAGQLAPDWNDFGLYMAGPGVAASADDLSRLVLSRANKNGLSLVPVEVSSMVAMRLVETGGMMTILSIGMPGASSALRLMMFPDGHLLGAKKIVDAVEEAVDFTIKHMDDHDFAKQYIRGA